MSEDADESEDESRAGRLRNRRRRSRGRAQQQEQEQEPEPTETEKDEPSETDKTSESSKPSEQSKPSKPQGGAVSGVKDEQIGTYMYLPESLVEELAYQFKLASAEYERELGEEFEKNRHWYPLVVRLGLEQLEDMDPEAMAEHLAAIRSDSE